jgi:hypothetical protein
VKRRLIRGAGCALLWLAVETISRPHAQDGEFVWRLDWAVEGGFSIEIDSEG